VREKKWLGEITADFVSSIDQLACLHKSLKGSCVYLFVTSLYTLHIMGEY